MSEAACPRILHVITRLDPGGSATNTIVSVDLLRKHGFATALAYGVTNDPNGKVAADLAGRAVEPLTLPHLVRNPEPVSDLRALTEIKALLANNAFDIVHTHSSKAGVLGRLAAASSGIPAIHTPHGHIFYGYFGGILTSLFVFIERWMARRTKRIVSLTDRETAESLERGIGTVDQYVTIPSGVPLASFRNIPSDMGSRFRREHAIPPGALLFVSVGRLVPVKGFDILIRAFAEAGLEKEDARLAIVGDGAEMSALEQIALDTGVRERVIFTGALDDVRGALGAGDVFVLASRNEGMGRAVIEAMAAGLPILATSVGGIPTVVTDHGNGILVPADDSTAMARAMEEIGASPGVRSQFGEHAATAVYPEYDQETMIEQLAALYREVLK